MTLLKRWLIGVVVLLALAACSPSPASPTAIPEHSKPPTMSPSQAMDIGAVEAGSFKAVVDGAVLHDFQGTGLYAKMEDGSLFITLTNLRDVKNATVSIILPPGTQPGQYTLNPYQASLSGETNVTAVAAGLSIISPQGSPNTSDMYTLATSGSLDLKSLTPASGTFQFSAQTDSGRTVTVSGSFNQIPLQDNAG